MLVYLLPTHKNSSCSEYVWLISRSLLVAKRISAVWISHQLCFSYNAPTSAEQRKPWMFVGPASPETQTRNIHVQLPGCYCSIYFAFNHLLIDLALQLKFIQIYCGYFLHTHAHISTFTYTLNIKHSMGFSKEGRTYIISQMCTFILKNRRNNLQLCH